MSSNESSVPKKIQILHIIKSLGRGGAEMLLPETLKFHDRERFEFHYVYFLPWKNAMVEAIENNGGKVTCLSAGNNFQILWRINDIARYVRDHGIQLIHAHLPWAGIVARIAGRLTQIPVMYTEHNKQERYHFLTRWCNVATLNFLSKMIAVSRDVEESVRRFKPGLKVPLETILNGVDVGAFAPGHYDPTIIRKKFSISAGTPVVGTVAVFRTQKRLDLWLEIAKRIVTAIPETCFIVVGDGPLKDQLESRKVGLGLEAKVFFAGRQTDVKPYLASFDIFMMTSVFEGLPVAMLEAMASGCAVISTDAGGVKEVIRHGVDGLLCPVSEPFGLVGYACDLIKDEGKRKEFSTNGRQRISDSFNIKKMVLELEKSYLELTLENAI